MRVLLISDVYFPRINGVSTSIQTLLRALSKEDEACLIAPKYDTPWDDESHDVIRIRSHPTPGDRLGTMKTESCMAKTSGGYTHSWQRDLSMQ
jgi:hypothetical protein